MENVPQGQAPLERSEQLPHDDSASNRDDSTQAKRHRTLKACDTCRSRKLKCDGQTPCHRCQLSSTQCKYTHVEKRRKLNATNPSSKKSSKTSAIQTLDQRMSKLESLISSLVTKLDPTALNQSANTPFSDVNKTNDSRDTYTPSTQNEYSSAGSDNDEPTNNDTSINKDHQQFEHHPTRRNSRVMKNFKLHLKDSPASYLGSQTSLSILGPKGLKWLARRAGDPTISRKFLNLHKKFRLVISQNFAIWTDFDRDRLVPFPPRSIVNPIVQAFFVEIGFGEFIIEEKELNGLFDLYYASQERPDQPRLRKLTNSDLLILSSVIALGALFQMDDPSLTTGSLDLKNLLDLRDRYLRMAVYCYHKVCVLSEGLKTLQGLLLLILNSEISPTPHVNYMLVSTAVRYAQDMGLHRAEVVQGFGPDESLKRRRLWYYVHLLDSNICMRSGKPPIINAADVTHPLITKDHRSTVQHASEESYALMHSPNFNPADPNHRAQMEACSKDPKVSPLKLMSFDYLAEYIGLSSKAYDSLFNATALQGKSAIQIMNVISDLNDKLESITERIPVSIRPGHKIDPAVLATPEGYTIVMLQFQYHLQAININRMASKRSWSHDDLEAIDENSPILPKQRKFIVKSLESARSILNLFEYLDNFQPLFFIYCSFFFYSAFFTLFAAAIENPASIESRNDLLSMKRKGEVFLMRLSQYSERHLDKMTFNVLSYLLKFFLQVAIAVHNNTIKPGDGLTKIDTTALENEITLHDKILSHSPETDIVPDNIFSGWPKYPKERQSSANQNSKSPNDSTSRNALPIKGTFSHEVYSTQVQQPPSLQSSTTLQQLPTQHHQQKQQQQQQQNTNDLTSLPPVLSLTGTPQPNKLSENPPHMDPFDFALGNPTIAVDAFHDQLDLGGWDMGSNSSVLHQLFAIPNIYLNNTDLESLDRTPNSNTGENYPQTNTGNPGTGPGTFDF